MNTIPTYEKATMYDRLNYAASRRFRDRLVDSLRYAVKLDLTAFSYNEDQLLYVFDPQLDELEKQSSDTKSFLNTIATACAMGTIFNTWAPYTGNEEDTFAIPFITLLEKTEDYVIYGLVGWPGTTKQFRKFAKDNFKFYRLIKSKGYFDRPSYNIKIESQDLLFKTLTGEMIPKESIV